MKKIIFLTMLFGISLSLFAQVDKGVKFEQGTLAQVLSKAKNNKKDPKLVFLDCYTSWCGPCKYMANNVFPTEAAGKYFNAKFINIKIDMEKGEGPELVKRFKITGYPTFLILSPDGEEIGRVMGANDLELFVKSVEKVKDVTKSAAYLKNIFENSKTSENAVFYVEAMERNALRSQLVVFMNENLSVFNKEDLLSDRMWKHLRSGISYDHKIVLEYLIDNKVQASSMFGVDRVNGVLEACYKKVLIEYLRGKRDLTKDEVIRLSTNLSLVLGIGGEEGAMYAKLAKWQATGNFTAIAETFKWENLMRMKPYDILLFEDIFAKYDCVTKQMFEKYYKSKKQLSQMQAKSAEKVEEKIILGKN
ncbi:MAG: thioredoxin family protein [Bacteroidales bacterium]